MSDDQSFGTKPGTTDAGAGSSDATTTPMPPTPPIGSEAVEHDAAESSTDAAGGTTTGGTTTGDTTTIGKVAGAAADAARTAGSRLREAAESADLDQFADDAKRVTGEWTEKVKAEYRRRPGVVIGVAIAGLVVLGGIARALRRRR